jgi:hypothetical protein
VLCVVPPVASAGARAVAAAAAQLRWSIPSHCTVAMSIAAQTAGLIRKRPALSANGRPEFAESGAWLSATHQHENARAETVACRMLRVACCALHFARRMLARCNVACCMSRAALCALHVACRAYTGWPASMVVDTAQPTAFSSEQALATVGVSPYLVAMGACGVQDATCYMQHLTMRCLKRSMQPPSP